MPAVPIAKPLFVVIDANIIYSWSLNDYLLWIATPLPDSTDAPIFVPLWSEEIIAEVRRNTTSPVQSRIDRQLAMFPEAMVEDLAGHLGRVPPEVDPKDRHVVAAALAADASIIVTDNLRDFAVTKLKTLGIDVLRGDAFLCHLLDQHPGALVDLLADDQDVYLVEPSFIDRATNVEIPIPTVRGIWISASQIELVEVIRAPDHPAAIGAVESPSPDGALAGPSAGTGIEPAGPEREPRGEA